MSGAGADTVQVNTSMGSFTVELYPRQAPKTCQNFLELARRGYYDGVVFHRIIKVCASPSLAPAHAIPCRARLRRRLDARRGRRIS